jgi:hypothetical protein
MPISTPYTGTATITSTELSMVSGTTTLQTVANAPGVYQVVADLSALASGGAVDLRLYEAARSGGTKRLVYTERFTGPLTEPMLILPSTILVHGWDYTLQKASGTDRAVSWSIHRAA